MLSHPLLGLPLGPPEALGSASWVCLLGLASWVCYLGLASRVLPLGSCLLGLAS
ncbi:hypothetical protein K469DRAFT_252635 [Zopfia rhizophila CBS 207.26]|uniref:Uncharacterized protein n=1 Tax=Zopfia rhizophila CBS 207.26 TaxID=1314779 RepID=A0A6A6DR50_9PEZI|nr:hypothetical protein K469DRAFT_252635 [Zopfia rhizophila CBS 207.26]